jgi:hypothetical protein
MYSLCRLAVQKREPFQQPRLVYSCPLWHLSARRLYRPGTWPHFHPNCEPGTRSSKLYGWSTACYPFTQPPVLPTSFIFAVVVVCHCNNAIPNANLTNQVVIFRHGVVVVVGSILNRIRGRGRNLAIGRQGQSDQTKDYRLFCCTLLLMDIQSFLVSGVVRKDFGRDGRTHHRTRYARPGRAILPSLDKIHEHSRSIWIITMMLDLIGVEKHFRSVPRPQVGFARIKPKRTSALLPCTLGQPQGCCCCLAAVVPILRNLFQKKKHILYCFFLTLAPHSRCRCGIVNFHDVKHCQNVVAAFSPDGRDPRKESLTAKRPDLSVRDQRARPKKKRYGRKLGASDGLYIYPYTPWLFATVSIVGSIVHSIYGFARTRVQKQH